MTKKFDVYFRKESDDVYRAYAGEGYGEPNWEQCPVIEGCSVSRFLDKFEMVSSEVKVFEVTIAESDMEVDPDWEGAQQQP